MACLLRMLLTRSSAQRRPAGTRRSARLPGCAATCRWRSRWSLGSCRTTRRGRWRAWRLISPLRGAGWTCCAPRTCPWPPAFDVSYRRLTERQRRPFRRMGRQLGVDIEAYAAALDSTSLAAIRRGQDALYDRHLVTEPVPGRYMLHDLLRAH